LHELLQLLEEPVKTEEDQAVHEKNNSDFHQIIVRSSNNRRLMELYEGLQAHIKIARIHGAESNWATRLQEEQAEHEAIVAAIVKRDASELCAALRKHIYRAKDALVSTLRVRNG